MRCLPPSTSPWLSHALRIRLTVCKVVPVISADVLPADGKIDLDPGVNFPSCLLGQAQQSMRDALLNLLIRHFHDAGLRVLKATSHGLERASCEARVFDDQAVP